MVKFAQEKLRTQTREVATLNDVLASCYGNQTECARVIGVHRETIKNRLNSGQDLYLIVNREDGKVTFTKCF